MSGRSQASAGAADDLRKPRFARCGLGRRIVTEAHDGATLAMEHRRSSSATRRHSHADVRAITNRTDRLVAKGLVTREVDPTNRRTVLIDLTNAGRELIDRAVVDHLDIEENILAALTPRQQEQLAGLLRTILVSVGDVPKA